MRTFLTSLAVCLVLLSGCGQPEIEWAPLSAVPKEGAYTVLRGEARLGSGDHPPRGQVSSLNERGEIISKNRVQMFSADFQTWKAGELAVANDRVAEMVLIRSSGDARRIKVAGPTSALGRLPDGSVARLANLGQRPDGYLTVLEILHQDESVARKLDLKGHLVGLSVIGDSMIISGSDGGTQSKVVVVDSGTLTIRGQREYQDSQSIVRCGPADVPESILCAEQRQDNNPSYFTEGYNRYLVRLDIKDLTKMLVARSDFEITNIFRHKGRITLLTTEGLALLDGGRVDVRLRIGNAEDQATTITRHGDIGDVTVEHVGAPGGPRVMSSADVVRVDLENLRELRRTRAHYADDEEEYWRLVFIPQEFFQGAELKG